MKGLVKNNRWVEVEGKEYRISKVQSDLNPKPDTIVEIEVINEYPEGCDAFCDGDETCMICYASNEVVRIIE